jgi:hypothetical protein
MVNTLSSMEREPAIEIGFAKSGDGPGIAAVQKVGWFAAYPDTSVGLTKEDILIHKNNFESGRKQF